VSETPASPVAAPVPTQRLDKWLWFARFCKSRSLATRLVETGRIRLAGQPISKAHQQVRAGDVLTFPLGAHVRVIRIIDIGKRRGPPAEARTLYEDLAPPPPREPAAPPPAAAPAGEREAGAGRPTKAERRAIDRLQGGE
jgi:ribosome-associated heat shock protein Hsp15